MQATATPRGPNSRVHVGRTFVSPAFDLLLIGGGLTYPLLLWVLWDGASAAAWIGLSIPIIALLVNQAHFALRVGMMPPFRTEAFAYQSPHRLSPRWVSHPVRDERPKGRWPRVGRQRPRVEQRIGVLDDAPGLTIGWITDLALRCTQQR